MLFIAKEEGASIQMWQIGVWYFWSFIKRNMLHLQNIEKAMFDFMYEMHWHICFLAVQFLNFEFCYSLNCSIRLVIV
jgi:hypothetical protein